MCYTVFSYRGDFFTDWGVFRSVNPMKEPKIQKIFGVRSWYQNIHCRKCDYSEAGGTIYEAANNLAGVGEF